MRIALGISYQGSAYQGWQIQAQEKLPTIQATLEAAIGKVADHSITISCAGRTDKGVHALGQVAHFDTTAMRSDRAWLLGINSHLPADIRIDWVREMTNEFHARFSALSRRYQYIIYNKPLPSALWYKHTTHCYIPLNETLMQTAANYLIGEHDFSSFRAASCQSKSAMRHVYKLEVYRQGDFIIIDITANAFLHHMVRNITGLLMLIGAAKREPGWAKDVLCAKDRTKSAVTAHPNGLYLYCVSYPDFYLLPRFNNNLFLF